MFRVLVLGKTQEISKEAAAWAVSGEMLENTYGKKYEINGLGAVIRTFPLWIGQKGAAAIGDVVLIVAKAPEDLSAIRPLLTPYKRIPLKFVLYDGVTNQGEFEAEFKAIPIKKGTPTEFVERLIESSNELVKLITSVFKNFDKNNDGFIELGELQALSKELGSELKSEEAKKMIKIMDVNKDGKISLEELIAWWKTGCRGSSQRIMSLIKKVTKNNVLLQNAIASLESIKSTPETDRVINTKFGVYLSKIEKPGMMFDVTILSIGKELEEEFKTFAYGIGVAKNDLFVGFSFGVKNPAAATKTLEQIINSSVMLGINLSPKAADVLSDLEFKFGSTQDKAIVCAIPSVKGSTDLAPFMPFLEKLSNVMLPNQTISIKLCTATDFEKLSTDERALIDLLFDGISFEVLGQFNPYLKERIVKIVKAVNILQGMPPALQNVMPQALGGAVLSTFNGEIEFEPTPELKETLREPIGEVVFSTPVKSLKEMLAPQLKENISSLPLLQNIHKFFKDEVTSINLLVYVSNLGAIRVRFDIPGLYFALNFE
jgi:hypothetical protein